MQLELTLKPKVTDTLLCHGHAHKHFHAKHNIWSEYVNGAFAHQGFGRARQLDLSLGMMPKHRSLLLREATMAPRHYCSRRLRVFISGTNCWRGSSLVLGFQGLDRGLVVLRFGLPSRARRFSVCNKHAILPAVEHVVPPGVPASLRVAHAHENSKSFRQGF